MISFDDHHCCAPQHLCDYLAQLTGYRSATVDVLLWRAYANGVIDSRSGRINVAEEAG